MYKARAKATKPPIRLEQTSYKGYASFYSGSIMPKNFLEDMLNMDLVMDARPRPRPSTVQYGAAFLGTCIGIDTFIRMVLGKPEHWEISMQVIGGVGHICTRKDGGTWNDLGGSYSTTHWVNFCMGNGRVMISNKTDTMSYYDIVANSLVTYVALTDPVTPTGVATVIGGTTQYYYYRYTGENANGETARSASVAVGVTKTRDKWAAATEYVTITGTTITNAVRYNWYIGDVSGQERYAGTTNTAVFKDDGTADINPIRTAPLGNSTKGPILGYMWNDNGQFYGVDDKDNPSYLWYSGTGTDAGSWSPFLGGGYVGINYGGDSIPVGGLAYRDGKGTAAVTVLTRGSAGGGGMYHIVFNTQTVGTTTFAYPEVYPANGQAGAYGSRVIIQSNNDVHYMTGLDFKKTGTTTNIVNVLDTRSTSQLISEDLKGLNLSALDNSCGVEFEGANYWALPNGSSTNNEIWKQDLTRGGIWILRWTIAAQHLWKYEDNSGYTHLLALVNNKPMEFTRNVLTQDDGVVFPTRLASGGLTFGNTGQELGSIQTTTHKLLNPVGAINASTSGLDEDLNPTNTLSSDTFTQTTSNTGWNEAVYNLLEWNHDRVPQSTSAAVGYIRLEPDETLNQLDWEITTNTPSDYILASSLTIGSLTKGRIGD